VATIDTGASRSFVSETVARGLTTAQTQRIVCTRITLADGSQRKVTQALMVGIQWGQRRVTIPMLVMSTITDDVILGIDFLSGVAAELRCGQAQLKLQPTAGRPTEIATTIQTSPQELDLTRPSPSEQRRMPGLPEACAKAMRKNPFRIQRKAA